MVLDVDGQGYRPIQRGVEVVDSLLVARRIVGRHGDHGVGAGLLRVRGEGDCLGGGARAHTDDDRHPAPRPGALVLLHGDARHRLALVFGEGGEFAGVDRRDDAVGARLDAKSNHPPQRVLIERAAFREWRDGDGKKPAMPWCCAGPAGHCGAQSEPAIQPPSTAMTCPVTKSEAEEARNTAVPARSSGAP